MRDVRDPSVAYGDSSPYAGEPFLYNKAPKEGAFSVSSVLF